MSLSSVEVPLHLGRSSNSSIPARQGGEPWVGPLLPPWGWGGPATASLLTSHPRGSGEGALSSLDPEL